MEDSPENLQKMQESFEQLRQEFSQKLSSDVPQAVEHKAEDTVKVLRNYIQAFSDVLLAQANNNSLEVSAQQITETIAQSIEVNRVSIWLYQNNNTEIICVDLYEKDKERHSKGTVLRKADFPKYFDTISNKRTLSADDVHTHPGTMEFSEVYSRPNGISSLLDVPVFVKGQMVGVICHEHTGLKRKWTSDEENFAYLMSNILSNNMK